VAALADPDRGLDAVVIGKCERAFYGSQYASMAPLFEHFGVTLRAPEVGGRVDWHDEDHEQTMLALAHLAAIGILLAGPAEKPTRGNRSLAQMTGPASVPAGAVSSRSCAGLPGSALAGLTSAPVSCTGL
jgi:hypothetical protein